MNRNLSAPESAQQSDASIRVLVVDDSAFMRFAITKHLNEAPGITVVGSARDGLEALELIPRLNPDVVTLDVEMPRLDGLGALKRIMSEFPRPVLMLSSLTVEGARETVQALTAGAVDFVAKPSNKANIETVMVEAIAKIRKAAKARVYKITNDAAEKSSPTPAASRSIRAMRTTDKIVVIGSSTGGPRALNTVIPLLPANLPAAILIVQHMPVGFTRSLAERLDTISQISVKEAAPGDKPEVGRALLAPGGFHMVLDRDGQVSLNQNPTVHGVRPAIDVTMISVAQRFGNSTIGVVLTGMGSDGTNGCTLIRSLGGHVITEDESTAVVWGMPRSVYESGAAHEVIPLPDVARAIQRAVNS